jgi:hypothetical protein
MSWFREDESTTNTGWNSTVGLFTPSGFASLHSARIHTTSSTTGIYGDLDWWVDMSGCGTANKVLTFNLSNLSGNDFVRVFLSEDGGVTFTQKGQFASDGSNSWLLKSVLLGNTSNSNCVIRFRAYAASATTTDIGIDQLNISVTGTASALTVLGGGNICQPGQGQSGVTIIANGASTYAWAPTTGITGSGSTVIAAPTASTIYTITGTDANCLTATETVAVNVSPKYEISCNPLPQNLCVGGSSFMKLNDTIYGSPTPPTYLNNTLHTSASFCITNVLFEGINNTSSATCSLPSYNFYNTPVPQVIAGLSYSISVTTSQDGGAIAAWLDYNGDGIFQPTEYTSIANTSIPTVTNLPNSININIPASAKEGVVRLRVRSHAAAAGIATGDANVLFSAGGETEDYLVRIIKVSNSTLTYSWAPLTYVGNVTSTSATATNVTSSITYTVVASDAGFCSSSTTISLTVAPLSCNSIIANSLISCANSSSVLKSNITGGGQPYSYLWTGPNANGTTIITVGITDSVIVSPAVTSTYTLSVTDFCGNSCSTTVTINVNPISGINIANSLGGPIQICGTSTNATSLLATGAATYTWTPAPFYSNATGDSVRIQTFSPINYLVTATDVFGCTKTTFVPVSYWPNYSLAVKANPTNICANSSTLIYATDTVFGAQNIPPVNYCFNGLHSGTGSACLDSFVINATALPITGLGCGTQTYYNQLSSVSAQVQAGTSINLSSRLLNNGFVGVWIDLNKDGNLDASEYVQTINNSIIGSTTFNIPNSTLSGATLMRVRTSNLLFANTDACSTIPFGETHDFLIGIYNLSPAPIINYSWSPIASLVSSNTQQVVTNLLPSTTNFVVTTTDVNGCTKQAATQVVIASLQCTGVLSSSGLVLCDGGNTSLTVNTIGGGLLAYSWLSPTGIIGSTKSINVNPTSGTTYTVVVTDGCAGNATCSTTITIGVNPALNISYTTVPTSIVFCSNTSNSQVTLSGGISYSWAAALNPSNITTLTATQFQLNPNQSNTYTITAVGANGCTATTSLSITVAPPIQLQATVTPDTIGTCLSNATLIASDTTIGPDNHSMNNYCVSTALATQFDDITKVEFGTLSNSSTCSAIAPGINSISSLYSNYTNLPNVGFVVAGTAAPYTFEVTNCSPSTIVSQFKVFADLNGNGLFTDPGENLVSNIQTAIGSYTLTGNVFIPAHAKAGTTRLRIMAANSNVIASDPSCLEFTYGEVEDYLIEVKRVSLSTMNYTWQPGNLNGNNVIVNPSSSTTYTLTGVDAFGCVASSSTASLVVGGLICNNIQASKSSICFGDSTTLSILPTLGTAPYTYQWNNGSIASSIIVAPSVTSNYSVIVTDACGATCATTITINVNGLPTVTFTSSLPIGGGFCAGGTATVTATTSASSPTYMWEPSANFIASNTNPAVINYMDVTTIYTLTVLDNTNNCTSTHIKTIVYSPAYQVTAEAIPNNICANGNSILKATDTVVSNAPLPLNYCAALHNFSGPCIENVIINTYTNNTSNACSTSSLPATLTPVATVYAGNNLSLSVTTTANTSTSTLGISAWVDFNRNGIFESATEWFQVATNAIGSVPNVISIPIPANAVPGNTTLRIRARTGISNTSGNSCAVYGSGETEDYNINIIGTSTNPTINSYTWTSISGVLANTISTSVSNIPSTQTYTVTATNALGCTATASTTVAVTPLQIDSIKGREFICLGDIDTIRSFISFGSAPYTYSWQPFVQTLAAFPDKAIITPTGNTIYTLTVTDGCGTMQTKTYEVLTNVPPFVFGYGNVPGVCVTGSVVLNALGADTYTWTPSSFLNITTGATVISSNPTNATTYTIEGTDNNTGCIGTATVDVLYSDAFYLDVQSSSSSICASQPVTLKLLDTISNNNSTLVATCVSGAVDTVGQDITAFSLTNNSNGINNASGCNGLGNPLTSSLNRYNDYTNLSNIPIFYSGDSLTLNMNVGNCSGPISNSAVKVFIDYNNDGDFLDQNEFVYGTNTVFTGAFSLTAGFKVPVNITPGFVRVRAIVLETNLLTSIPSCNPYNIGETEDYKIQLVRVANLANTTFIWSPATVPSNAQTVVATPTGTTVYTVTVQNAIGCWATATTQILVAPLVAQAITGNNNICLGQNTTLYMSVLGGSPPYNYSWNNGASTSTVNVSPITNTIYTATVTDGCGNMVTATYLVNVFNNPIVTATSAPISASLCTNGTLTLSATCPSCANMTWFPGGIVAASAAVSPIISTTYTVVGTDGLGCTKTSSIYINRAYDHTIQVTQSPSIICNGDAVSLILKDSTLSQGSTSLPVGYCVPTHTSGAPCITALSFGTINNLTLNNCATNAYSTYTNNIPNIAVGTSLPIFLTFTHQNGNSGNAKASVWIDFNRDGVFQNTEYNIISSNAMENIQQSQNILIPANATPGYTKMRVRLTSVINSLTSNDACIDLADGETEDYVISILGLLPASNMTYAWTPTNVLSNTTTNMVTTTALTANTIYSVIATDAGGCSYSQTYQVNVPNAITASATFTNNLCSYDLNGQISVMASGGTPPYNYKINGGSYGTNNTFGSLADGTYTLTVEDANSCSITLTQIISSSSSPIAASISSLGGTCLSGNSVNVYVTTTGGVSPYNYTWIDDYTGNLITGATFSVNGDTAYNILAPLNILLTISDANGCFVANTGVTFSVTQPGAPLTVSASISSNINCNGGTGEITAVAADGNTTGGYTYQLDNGAFGTNNLFSTLLTGIYTITAKDNNLCTASTTVNLSQPNSLSISGTISDVLCNGGNSGTIMGNASGGTSPYSYKVNNMVIASNYAAGNYTLSVTDNNSCTAQTVVVISQPTMALSNLSAMSSGISCNGANNAIINTNATGGSAPYAYLINNNAPLTNYGVGNYTVQVTDNNSCTSEIVINITQPNPITTTTSYQAIACNGGSTNITANAIGGAGTYTFAINNMPVNNPYASGLYTISATDNNGCMGSNTFNLTEPNPILLTVSKTDASCLVANGSITPIVSGGTSPINITINNGVILPNYSPSNYTVLATDNKGCTKDTVITINAATNTLVNTSIGTSALCNNLLGTISFSSTGANGSVTYLVNNAAPSSTYAPGAYTITATDINGCSSVTITTLTAPPNLTIAVSNSAIICNGASSNITASVVGSVGVITYNVNGSILNNPYNAGTYTISALDANGCSTNTVLNITEPSPIILIATPSTISCHNGSGTIAVAGSGGTGSLTYLINGMPLSSLYTAGTYTIQAKDFNQCIKDTIITIINPDPLTLTASNTAVVCHNGTAIISATATGGAGAFIYSVNNSALINPYSSGVYSVKVTDANGCSVSSSLSISNPAQISITVSATPINCNGATSTVTPIASGGTGMLIVNVNNSAFSNPYNAGIYTVSAMDQNNCITSTILNITEPTPITIDASSIVNTTCLGSSIYLNAIITGPYTSAVWGGNGNTYNNSEVMIPAVLGTYIYTLTASNANCSSSTTLNIIVNSNSGIITQANNGNIMSMAGSSCDTTYQADGDTVNYFDSNCNLIASIFDPSGGILLGGISNCAEVMPTGILFGSQAYAPRVFDILPQTQGPAQITLYYTNDDFLAYNNFTLANGLVSDSIATGATASLLNGQIAQVNIYKYTGGGLGVGTLDAIISTAAIWNLAMQRWEVTFNVSSFSKFYIGSYKPIAPLSVKEISIKALEENTKNKVIWIVNEEIAMDKYILERGDASNDFKVLDEIKCKTPNGNSNTKVTYTYLDNDPLPGVNNYRVKVINLDGSFVYSGLATIFRATGEKIYLYPNPAKEDINVLVQAKKNQRATLTITDVAGRITNRLETNVEKGQNSFTLDIETLSPGTYYIQLKTADGITLSQKFIKQ